MTIQEIATWATQLKSLATQIQKMVTTAEMSQLQASGVNLNIVIALSYFAITLLNFKASRVYSLLAFLFTAVIAYTAIYAALPAVQYHALFAIIYLSVTYKVKPVKAKVACCLLGSFQIIMAWDSYINAQIETFIWLHYEVIVCLLHALIIGSFLERDAERIKRHLERFASFVRNLFGYSCNRLCLWYY